jgi:hypothetical protein
VDLSSIRTLRNLQEGLKECLRIMARSDRATNPLRKTTFTSSSSGSDERG